jgi:hypothetical protein
VRALRDARGALLFATWTSRSDRASGQHHLTRGSTSECRKGSSSGRRLTGDEAGPRWLAHEATILGVEATSEVFKLDRLEPVACYLELDGERIPGVPAFDAPGTGADGVTGPLSSSAHEAILVMRLSPRSVYTGEYERLRRDATHRALVMVCSGGTSRDGLVTAPGEDTSRWSAASAVPSAGRPLAARNRYGRGNRDRYSGCRFSRQADTMMVKGPCAAITLVGSRRPLVLFAPRLCR